MKVAISLPDHLAQRLSAEDAPDLPRRVLEAVAAQGYRDGQLTLGDVRTLLDFETRMQTERFLNQKGAFLRQSRSELEQDLQSAERASRL